jgi:hypothetical protein
MKKKRWGVPKLKVLVRGKPEEGVLMQCKMAGLPGAGGQASGCISERYNPPGGGQCQWCSGNAWSS